MYIVLFKGKRRKKKVFERHGRQVLYKMGEMDGNKIMLGEI